MFSPLLRTTIRVFSRVPVSPLTAAATTTLKSLSSPLPLTLTRAKHTKMSPIELFSSATPNGDKVHILLEELGTPYDPKTININIGEQLTREFIAINPNNRIPAIIDPEGDDGKPLKIFESGAILVYLAEKEGKFISAHPARKAEVMSWLMWQMGGVGPMIGQLGHFMRHSEKIPYAITRYTEETKRLLRILNRNLESNDWVAAGEYSIADMAIYPWIRAVFERGMPLDGDYSNIKRWLDQISARPAVQRAYKVCRIENEEEKNRFLTFPMPENFEQVNIYDVKAQAERKLH